MTTKGRPVAIVDTSVLSYFFNGSPLALAYERLLADYEARVSFMTVAEFHYGAEKRRWSQRRRLELEVQLHRYPVVPFNEGMATIYGEVLANRERAGRPMDRADAWIATTAIFHDVPLATNDSDFHNTPGLRLLTLEYGEMPVPPRMRVATRPARPQGASCGCSY